MPDFFRPFWELCNGQAYCPHPADAGLSLGRRFQEQVLVIIGGGGTAIGWTQRIRFDREGKASFALPRSLGFKRGTSDWNDHLRKEAKATAGWAVLLLEQQWQATASRVSAASLGASGVEQMLRVREAIADFGDDRLSDDAIRVTIDHPTMEGAIVVGVRALIVDALEQEAVANGFQLAAVRVATLALFERHMMRLQKQAASPANSFVIFDGQSALLVGIRDGAFDCSEGGVSYLVNRSTADVRAQLLKRIGSTPGLREWGGRVEVIGTELPLNDALLVDSLDLQQRSEDAVLASVDESVTHDFRANLREMRTALPRWMRQVFFAAVATIVIGAIALSLEALTALRLEEQGAAHQIEARQYRSSTSEMREELDGMKREEASIRQIADWIDRNYHAQELVQTFLNSIPTEVSVSAVSIQATEGLPQAKLKFTLFGSEEAQRSALRSIEERLYQLGYEIGRRDDPLAENGHRGGVIYAWDLILPTFGT